MDNTYVTNIPRAPLSSVCDAPAESYTEGELMRVFEKGVASDALVPDEATGRIPVAQLSAHVQKLESSGVLMPRPSVAVGESVKETDMKKLIEHDAAMYANLQREYCFYEQRYRYALKAFLIKATSRDAADIPAAQAMLTNTKTLNRRVNSVLEVMNYLAQARVDIVNANKAAVNTYNANINSKMNQLQNTYSMLNKDNAIVLAQKEAVRYTEEKNKYTANQIALWAGLNIVALGTIFYVYRA